MNHNPALGSNFLLEIPRLEEVNYFVQNAEIPGLTMSGLDAPYRNNQGVLPSNRIDYDPLTIQFVVDEEYVNWFSMVMWMQSIRKGDRNITEEMSDITLHLVNSNKSLGKQLMFRGAFPTSMQSIQLDSTIVDATVSLCSVTFRFQYMELVKPGQ